MTRVLVIGLDCASPELVFGRLRGRLPHLSALMDGGVFGPLESTIPPITCPAWASLVTGLDPGELGLYGLRNRRDRSYAPLETVSSLKLEAPAVWDILGARGKRSIVVGVPPGYPPRPLPGWRVSCFLTPSAQAPHTYPPELGAELAGVAGELRFDVGEYRGSDTERIFRDIREMTHQHFAVLRHLVSTRDWDLAFGVYMGLDRLHHAALRFLDPDHPRHDPASPLRAEALAIYEEVDREIGALVRLVGDETAVLVVSDHGARPLLGGLCINQWLLREGYLRLLRKPDRIAAPRDVGVDWAATTAWAEGGYYARVFLNVAGREPEGRLPAGGLEQVKKALAARISALPGPDGQPLGNRVFLPEQCYRALRGVPPDLIVYPGDLAWRAVGTVGHTSIYVAPTHQGLDDANHAEHGIFLLRAPGQQRPVTRILDCAQLILDLALHDKNPPRT